MGNPNLTASDGFAALADLDGNQDGVVNAADAAFSSLRVWRDLDQDGVTDAGELLTLAYPDRKREPAGAMRIRGET